jgi:tRNA 2-selenouridine synthase
MGYRHYFCRNGLPRPTTFAKQRWVAARRSYRVYPAMSATSNTASATALEIEHYPDIIDARSEGEYAEDFIPGALNHPVLNNDERARVGTLNKVASAFEAKRMGAALVSRNIANLLEQHFAEKPRDWAPLIYCWRGGKRSRSLTLVLREIGFKAVQLDGGYKAYRTRVAQELTELPKRFNYVTICGCTGTGKTALLLALRDAGAQVIDLEGLANHKGSLLGEHVITPQPTQKRFDSLLWAALRRLDPTRPVFVESESKKIGLVQMPESMREQMAAGTCVWLDVPVAARVAHLRGEYVHFVNDPALLMQKLAPLKALRGGEMLARWQTLASAGNINGVVESLLVDHYDPLYITAIKRNYSNLKDARHVAIDGLTVDALSVAAHALLKPPVVLGGDATVAHRAA